MVLILLFVLLTVGFFWIQSIRFGFTYVVKAEEKFKSLEKENQDLKNYIRSWGR